MQWGHDWGLPSLAEVSLRKGVMLLFPSESVVPPELVSTAPFFRQRGMVFPSQWEQWSLILVWGPMWIIWTKLHPHRCGFDFFSFLARHYVEWPGGNKWQAGCVMWQHLTCLRDKWDVIPARLCKRSWNVLENCQEIGSKLHDEL